MLLPVSLPGRPPMFTGDDRTSGYFLDTARFCSSFLCWLFFLLSALVWNRICGSVLVERSSEASPKAKIACFAVRGIKTYMYF